MMQIRKGVNGQSIIYSYLDSVHGKTVILPAVSPDTDADASDRCEKADLVILAEVKGKSSHAGLEERKHYLDLLKKEPSGAVLLS